MTTSIAHELNQPLGSILTNAETAELMLKSASPNLDELRAILADIRRDDQRASEVIRRLRSMLKKTPFEVRDVQLNSTIREVVGFVADLAQGRGVVLSYAPAASELYVRGDPIHLQQVLLNLIINALDATAEVQTSKREISVALSRTGSYAEVTVRDTGPGIRVISRRSSIRSSPPSRRGWAWDWRSSVPSSRPTTARFRRKICRPAELCSRSSFRSCDRLSRCSRAVEPASA